VSAGGHGLRNRLYVRQLLLLLLLLVVVLDAVRLLSSSSSSSSSSLATLSTTSQRRCQLDDRPHDCSRPTRSDSVTRSRRAVFVTDTSR